MADASASSVSAGPATPASGLGLGLGPAAAGDLVGALARQLRGWAARADEDEDAEGEKALHAEKGPRTPRDEYAHAALRARGRAALRAVS